MFGPFVEHGLTMDEVRKMDLHDVALMHGYWKRNPPLRVLVASVAVAMGVNVMPQPEKTVKDLTAADYDLTPDKGRHMTLEEMQRLMASTGGKIDGLGQFGG